MQPAPAPRGSSWLQRRTGPVPNTALIGVAGVAGIYYYVRKKNQAAAAASTAATANGTSAYAAPAATSGISDAVGQQGYSQLSGQYANLASQVGSVTAAQAAESATANNAAGAAAADAKSIASLSSQIDSSKLPPGFGTVTIGGKTYDVLGYVGHQGTYQVSGGAPVYFASSPTATPKQGASNETAGALVLTPTAYAGESSAKPSPATITPVKAK